MEQFKIRCSAINSIASNPVKSKTIYSVGGKEITTAKYNKIVDSVLSSGDISLIQHVNIEKVELESEISEGAKTYCENWIKEKYFGRSNHVETKYTAKGIGVEEEALNILVRVLNLGMVYKNEERKTDDFKTGEIDFEYDGIIYDNKASYSFQTFPMFDTKLDKVYHDQQQGYLDLWNIEKARVCYTLVDTPIEILRNEVKWLEDDNARQTKALSHIFTKSAFENAKNILFPNANDIVFKEIEDKHRVKVFEVNRNRDFMNDIHVKVKGCQRYIDTLLSNL